jgi:hypothetical protein
MPGCLPGGGTGRWNGVSTRIGKELVARKLRRAFWPRPRPWPCTVPPARPPGTGASFSSCAMPRHRWHVPHVRGKRSAFPVPARSGGGTASLPWQGPSPLPQRHADPWPAGGPKPPASARPALGGRFSPAGSGAVLCWCGQNGSWWHCRARAGKRSAFPFPARRGGVPDYAGMPGISGRGHRPCHSAALIPGQPGAQSPRPAPAPPMAGASRPPGRALACGVPGPAGLRGTVPHGRRKRSAFPGPARSGVCGLRIPGRIGRSGDREIGRSGDRQIGRRRMSP